MIYSRLSLALLVCSVSARQSVAHHGVIITHDSNNKPHDWQPKRWDDPIDAIANTFNKHPFFETPAQRHPNETWRGHGKRKKKHLKEINKY